MLEKDFGPYSSNGTFLPSRDCGPNGKASDCSLRTNTISSVSEEICHGDPILRDQVESNSFHYQLNQVTEPVSDLSFLENAQQGKENGDLLFHGWPEMENFEDVDEMFRSCDSSFGLGIDNEYVPSWFSSSHAIEESNDALKPGFIFPGPDPKPLNDATDCDENLALSDVDCVIDEMYERDASVCWNSSSERLDSNKTVVGMNSSFGNGSETTTQIEAGDQANQMGDPTQLIENLCQCSSSQRAQYEQSTQPLTRNKPFTVKSEYNGGQSLPQNESSYPSNQMQDKGSCHGVAGAKNKAQSHQGKLSVHHQHPGLAVQSTSSDPIMDEEKIVNFESEVEGHSGIDVSGPCLRGELLDSSNVQDSACIGSMVDDVSLKESSFLQLQHGIEKLDVKTKLCIRDSLYRLAKSAENRCAELRSGGQGEGDESRVLASDKCTGIMDIETDTNPVDRSVAHLLFHTPSDLSVVATVVQNQNPCAEEKKPDVCQDTSSNDVVINCKDDGPCL